ncbi:cell division protein FtsZ, partial [Mesorhizobium sp. M2D.F.Ca.ET.145.01.1.1]
GATFDEELEGVIRVSVVATGIDKSAAEIAAAPISIRTAPPKPAARPAVAAVESRPVPVQQAVYEPRAADPVAEAIQLAEANAAAMAQARPAPVAHADDFRPQSKIFQAPPAQPMPQPVVQQMMQPAPQPREMLREVQQPVAMAPQRMPRVEDFPPVVKAEVDA